MAITLWTPLQWQKRFPAANDSEVLNALGRVFKAETIYARFDALADLIHTCNKINFSKIDNPYQVLSEQAFQFAAAIVDAKNSQELEKKFAARNQYKEIDPEFMPWKTPTTRTNVNGVVKRKDYVKASFYQAVKNIVNKSYSQVNATDAVGDLENKVNYLSAAEREKYRIFPSNGKFKQISLADNGSLQLADFDTKNNAAHGKENNAIFVMDPKGSMFAGTTINNVFHHSSFLAGNATIFAGTLSVTNGNLQDLTDNSGHYLPSSIQNIRALSFFRDAGILESRPEFHKWNDKLLRLERMSNIPEFTVMSLEIGDLVSSPALFQSKKEESPLIQAIKKGDISEVNSWVVQRSSLSQQDDDGRIPLAISILNNQPAVFENLLAISSHDEINTQDIYGMTPLLLAAEIGNSQILKQLLKQGANPNLTTAGGVTALTLAVFHQNKDAMHLLLENGANPNLDSDRFVALALQQNAKEIVALLTDPEYKINFNSILQNTIDSSSTDQTLLLLTSLPPDYNYTLEILGSLSEQSSNLRGEFITFLGDMPAENRQNIVNQVFRKENSLGALLDDAGVDNLRFKLCQNGYEELVMNFDKESESAKKDTMGKGGNTALIQRAFARISKPGKDIDEAPDYEQPEVIHVKKSQHKHNEFVENNIEAYPAIKINSRFSNH